MILKLSLTVLLLYYLGVLWKYYRQDIAGIFGTAETDEDTDGTGKEPGQPGEPYTVMGGSTYLPFAAEDGEEVGSPEPWTNPPRRTTGRTTPTSSRRRTRNDRYTEKTTVEKRTGMAVSAHKRTFCPFCTVNLFWVDMPMCLQIQEQIPCRSIMPSMDFFLLCFGVEKVVMCYRRDWEWMYHPIIRHI